MFSKIVSCVWGAGIGVRLEQSLKSKICRYSTAILCTAVGVFELYQSLDPESEISRDIPTVDVAITLFATALGTVKEDLKDIVNYLLKESPQNNVINNGIDNNSSESVSEDDSFCGLKEGFLQSNQLELNKVTAKSTVEKNNFGGFKGGFLQNKRLDKNKKTDQSISENNSFGGFKGGFLVGKRLKQKDLTANEGNNDSGLQLGLQKK